MHIAVLDANTDRSAFAARHPDEAGKFGDLMAGVAPDWRFTGFKVDDGVFPGTLAGFDGLVVSGSPASANDPDPWVDRLMDLLRSAHGQGMPMFGACFGHQAIARALGGRVGRNRQGWVLGRAETDNHSPAPWMDQAPAQSAHHAAHTEQVVELPPGARLLGGRADCVAGHLAVGNRVFTTQYHPEITVPFMDDLIGVMVPKLSEVELATARDSMGRSYDHQLFARWIKGFFDQARG